MWNTKKKSEKEKKTPIRNQNQNQNRNRNRKRKHRKGGKKKRQKRNSISVAEETVAWELPSTDPATDPPTDSATDPPTEAAAKRAKIKKQRSVVDHMKRLHSRFKSKKYKKRRERILFALKVFGGIAITAAEVIFIFA